MSLPPHSTDGTAVSHAELLIVPAQTLASIDQDALLARLGEGLARPGRRQCACGAYQIIVLDCDGLGRAYRAPVRRLEVIEGCWPQPLGFRLTASANSRESSWTLESDLYGVRPLYFGLDAANRPVASTRPEIVAALIGGRIAAQTVAELLLLGFPLDCHSVFDGVRRLRARQRLVHTLERGFSVNCVRDRRHPDPAEPDEPVGAGWVRALAPAIAEAFAGGAALELSGGVDSRLVLAAGLHAGQRPRLAFTLGSHDDDDVRIAAGICRKFGIDHVVLPAEAPQETCVSGGRRFVERSGFVVNACSYAGLPGALDRLAALRDVQIGGGGGECASGFYYSPFDALCGLPLVGRTWVHRRLFRSGIDITGLFGARRGRQCADDAADAVLRSLGWLAGSWRRRTDELYLDQRVSNAGGPVLTASSYWYRPWQPLLDSAYVEWGRRAEPSRKAGRRMQLAALRRLNATLAGIPLAGKRRGTTANILRRLRRRQADPDLGAAAAARAFGPDQSARQALRSLADRSEMRLSIEHLDRLISEPQAHVHELGALLGVAWAAETVDDLARRLRAAAPLESRRCAA